MSLPSLVRKDAVEETHIQTFARRAFNIAMPSSASITS
jgi:hypothetical protein